MEADREATVAQERVVESAQVERATQPYALVRTKLQEQDLAQQVRQLIGGRVRITADLGPRVGGLEARLLDQPGFGLSHSDLASMHPDIEDDPAGSPDGIGVHAQPKIRFGVEAFL